jgi:cell division protease FtsH
MPKKKPESKNILRNFVGFVFIFILFAAALSLYNSPFNEPTIIGMNEVAEHIQKNEVKEIVVAENTSITVTLNDEAGTVLQSQKEATESLQTLLTSYVVPTLFIILFLWIMMRQVQGTNNRAMMFGQTKTQAADPAKKNPTTFKDVAGASEAKEELEEIVDFLKHPKKFTALGARIPKGVLLMGSPGTGKTLLARAVAGEAGVPFFHISGSEFVEMFVGVGASRVRDFFKKAKKAAPAILFIDEIDAVGRQRGTGLGGSHDEREQTLNQILTEMDGFEPDTGVIVIAATNRPDVLDPALMRPGRFDRRVVLDLPDIKDREAILKVHAKNKIFEADVELKTVAQRTTGFSGADLMNVLNEAAIFAARHDRKKITMNDCLEAIDKVLLGPQRKNARSTIQEKEITAYHEAGHALVAHMLPDSDPVHKISIIPRGRAGGFTLKLPEEDKKLHSRKELLADIAVSLGGHAAETFKFGQMTTGASNDLEKATHLARRLITAYGMSDKMGPRTFGETSEMVFLGKEIHEQRDFSEKTAQNIDEEMDSIIRTQYTIVQNLIKDHTDKLEAIAKKLLEVETLERADFEALFAAKPAAPSTGASTNAA